MNQAVSFGLLGGGGILLTKALTGSSFSDVVKGKPGKIPNTGPVLTGASVAGVGSAIATGASSVASGAAAAGTGAATAISAAGYTNPLQHVTTWGRTDQGVDAVLPVGAPIVAPGKIKILGIIPNWFKGQPFIYFQLLDGPDAGQVQYVSEQITNLAPVGSILKAGQTIATYAPSGTAIEYGLATTSGQTLARATTGYVEGQVTPAGTAIRNWLRALGAPA